MKKIIALNYSDVSPFSPYAQNINRVTQADSSAGITKYSGFFIGENFIITVKKEKIPLSIERRGEDVTSPVTVSDLRSFKIIDEQVYFDSGAGYELVDMDDKSESSPTPAIETKTIIEMIGKETLEIITLDTDHVGSLKPFTDNMKKRILPKEIDEQITEAVEIGDHRKVISLLTMVQAAASTNMNIASKSTIGKLNYRFLEAELKTLTIPEKEFIVKSWEEMALTHFTERISSILKQDTLLPGELMGQVTDQRSGENTGSINLGFDYSLHTFWQNNTVASRFGPVALLLRPQDIFELKFEGETNMPYLEYKPRTDRLIKAIFNNVKVSTLDFARPIEAIQAHATRQGTKLKESGSGYNKRIKMTYKNGRTSEKSVKEIIFRGINSLLAPFLQVVANKREQGTGEDYEDTHFRQYVRPQYLLTGIPLGGFDLEVLITNTGERESIDKVKKELEMDCFDLNPNTLLSTLARWSEKKGVNFLTDKKKKQYNAISRHKNFNAFKNSDHFKKLINIYLKYSNLDLNSKKKLEDILKNLEKSKKHSGKFKSAGGAAVESGWVKKKIKKANNSNKKKK